MGPTAAGKTDVAHCIARQAGMRILSADAMLVYTDMNIGTAKPDAYLRREVPYMGINLITPDEDFSVGAFYRYAAATLGKLDRENASVIVAGGTGLYVKCLLQGLDASPSRHPTLRAEAERLLVEKGLSALQDRVRTAAPRAYATLADQQNPRRLIRLLEKAVEGARPEHAWQQHSSSIPVTGLRMPREQLNTRIAQRVHRMYDTGLLDEVRHLRDAYPSLSRTARQAIGYREAMAVLDGEYTLDQAMEKTIVRTRKLAKRQMTWFRHQCPVVWVDVEDGEPAEHVAARVMKLWKEYGPARISI